MIGNYIKIDLRASAIYVEKDNKIYVSSPARFIEEIRLLILNPSDREIRQIVSFKGSRSFLVNAFKGRMFIGIDDKLLIYDGHEFWEEVLSCGKPSNFFWHMIASKDGTIYVQEYGAPPTGIYGSADGKEWELVVSSNDIDGRARHFHSLAYDQYRDMLIATLGDRNYVRVAVSSDGGKNWSSLYKGAWQVFPLVILKDSITFGMDSGFARGGLVTWFPNEDRFEILHLRWKENRAKHMQMADLKLLNNHKWLAALGTPQAILASSNLREWCPVYMEGFDDAFHLSMAIGEGENTVLFTTGNSVISMHKNDLATYLSSTKPTIYQHRALLEKLKGVGYCLKRKLPF